MTKSGHIYVNSGTLMPQADMYCKPKPRMGRSTYLFVWV